MGRFIGLPDNPFDSRLLVPLKQKHQQTPILAVTNQTNKTNRTGVPKPVIILGPLFCCILQVYAINYFPIVKTILHVFQLAAGCTFVSALKMRKAEEITWRS